MSSVPQRIRILRYIAEQGIVSVKDVLEYFMEDHSPSCVRVSMYQMGIKRMKYGMIPHGVWYIKSEELVDKVRSYYPDLPEIKISFVPASQIPHSLGLNLIRNVFVNARELNVIKWLPESCLGEEDGFGATLYPDAVFWRQRNDGSKQKYFLEFERSLKNPARYKEIFTSYARREDTGSRNVIYICKDETIKEKLERHEKKLVEAQHLDEVNKYFQFITLKGFCQSVRSFKTPKKEEENNDTN